MSDSNEAEVTRMEEWLAAGFTADEATGWRYEGADLQTAEKWRDAGFDLMGAIEHTLFKLSRTEEPERAAMKRRDVYLGDIRSYCNLLPEAELLVISQVCQRMTQGFLEYGELDLKEERDWQKELREELVDALVYDAIIQIRGSGAE